MNFKTPNLPGASILYNAIARKVAEIEDKILTELNLATTAADLVAKIESDLLDLKEKTKGLMAELPIAAALNLQAELQALNGLSLGTDQYANKLASITTAFGPAIKSGGYNLDSIITDSASTISAATSALKSGSSSVSITSALSSKIPNFELPPGAVVAIEKAKASLLPEFKSLKELAHSFSESVSEDLVKGIFGDKKARDKLATDLAALEAKLKPAAAAFGAKAKRLEKRLSERRVNERTIEILEA